MSVLRPTPFNIFINDLEEAREGGREDISSGLQMTGERLVLFPSSIVKFEQLQWRLPGELGQEHIPCEEWLMALDLFSVQKTWIQRHLTAVPSACREGVKELGSSQWCMVGG